MADYIIHKQDENDFFGSLAKRDFELVEKMINSIIKATNSKKKKIDVFNVIFFDGSSLLFSIKKENYKECLENCIVDFEQQEQYEKCSEIKEIIKTL
jgi:hypothetical protein